MNDGLPIARSKSQASLRQDSSTFYRKPPDGYQYFQRDYLTLVKQTVLREPSHGCAESEVSQSAAERRGVNEFFERKAERPRKGGWKPTGQNAPVNGMSLRHDPGRRSRSEPSTHSVHPTAKERSSSRRTFSALHRELATEFSLRIMGLH